MVKKKAFSLLNRERFRSVSDYLRSSTLDKASFGWASYPKLPHKLKRNLRHLFREIELSGYIENSPLMKAVNFLQNLLRQLQVATASQRVGFSGRVHSPELASIPILREG